MIDFHDTLIKIKLEIEAIKSGKFDKIDNPIKNAPHTDLELASDNWEHKYSREEAALPIEFLRSNKFWPPVARVDNVYGDKNYFALVQVWMNLKKTQHKINENCSRWIRNIRFKCCILFIKKT